MHKKSEPIQQRDGACLCTFQYPPIEFEDAEFTIEIELRPCRGRCPSFHPRRRWKLVLRSVTCTIHLLADRTQVRGEPRSKVATRIVRRANQTRLSISSWHRRNAALIIHEGFFAPPRRRPRRLTGHGLLTSRGRPQGVCKTLGAHKTRPPHRLGGVRKEFKTLGAHRLAPVRRNEASSSSPRAPHYSSRRGPQRESIRQPIRSRRHDEVVQITLLNGLERITCPIVF